VVISFGGVPDVSTTGIRRKQRVYYRGQLPNRAVVSEVIDIDDEVGKVKRTVFATETCFCSVNIAHEYVLRTPPLGLGVCLGGAALAHRLSFCI
jgi:hypothetical protein